MVIAVRGQLGQVSHAQHLVRLGQLVQFATHNASHATADPHIDLVEDEGGHRVGVGEDGLQRQHEARRLTP